MPNWKSRGSATPALPAIVKTRMAHRIRQDGTGRTLPHPECWEARTEDGTWTFMRLDEPATPWAIIHTATRTDVDWTTSLKRCREYVARGWAGERLELLQAHERGEHESQREPRCGRC